MQRIYYVLAGIVLLTVAAGLVALPPRWPITINLFGRSFNYTITAPVWQINLGFWQWRPNWVLKEGLDIRGGIQVVLKTDMSQVPEADRLTALESAKDVLIRRVDLYGINEPVVQTAVNGQDYRLIVELAGVTDTNQALQLVGTVASLDFRLQPPPTTADEVSASPAAALQWNNFTPTGLSGQQLRRATVDFDNTTGQPTILLEFNDQGKELFGQVTKDHTGEVLGIFLDDFPLMLPRIQTAILDGRAQITGSFTVPEAKQLAIQLNAGALPVPIQVLGQRQLGASLGQVSVAASWRSGLIGLGLVMLFMILSYRVLGLLASLALIIYAILTIAIYKILGVTLTIPGIAGLLLTVGMAVDANILIFERIKEELRLGKPMTRAMELGFGRAWDSIKDANLATIATALVLINPLDFNFLNSSGLVRGFGLTLLVGVLISLFTGLVVTRTLIRLFLRSDQPPSSNL